MLFFNLNTSVSEAKIINPIERNQEAKPNSQIAIRRHRSKFTRQQSSSSANSLSASKQVCAPVVQIVIKYTALGLFTGVEKREYSITS